MNTGLQACSGPTNQTPIEVLLQVGDDGRVSARDTYSFLSPGQDDFARWARSNITENDFAESGADFTVTRIDAEYGNPLTGGVSKRMLTDYRLSVPFAKKLCMLSKTERGEQAREYFIAVEKTLRAVAQRLPQLTTNEMLLQLAQNAVELERRQEILESRVETAEQLVVETGVMIETKLKAFTTPMGDTWKQSMEIAIREVAGPDGDGWKLIKLKGKLYAELEVTVPCDLSVRQSRMRSRMKKQGATYRERNSVTKMDVIANDKQLRTIFEGIIKKYQVMHPAE